MSRPSVAAALATASFATSRGVSRETDPRLTRRAFRGYGRFPKSLLDLVELTGIEPVTS
jgi:hypothetical protein